MRVLTFNIQSCRAGVGSVAGVLQEADAHAMLLTEVRQAQSRELGRMTRSHVSFGRTWRVKPFGNAILTRESHAKVRHVRFTRTPGRQPRGLVAVRLRSGVNVAVTHLGLSGEERARHAREVLDALSEIRDPIVLGGDLNEPPSGPAVSVLLGRFRDSLPAMGTDPFYTHPAHAPAYRIDYVLVSGLEVRKASVLPTIASDHLAVVVELGETQ